MKKLCKALALAVLCVMSLALYAGASDFDGIAQELKDVGLFQGTDTGFELDRAPTRAESAVMLVRLLGAEETAKAELEAGETAHPFTGCSRVGEGPCCVALHQQADQRDFRDGVWLRQPVQCADVLHLCAARPWLQRR